MRNLTASDRSALIKLAASLPKGSPERRAILAGWQAAGARNAWDDNPYLGDKMNHAIVKYLEHLLTLNSYRMELKRLARGLDRDAITELAANDKTAASALRIINKMPKVDTTAILDDQVMDILRYEGLKE